MIAIRSHRKQAAGSIAFFAIAATNLFAAAFTPGNLVVERMGTGVTLTSGATAVSVDEYLPSTASQAAPVQTISLPAAGGRPSSNPFNLMDSGSATSDGQMSRSIDGTTLQLPGYNGTNGDASIVNSDGITITRVIGTINASATVDTSRTANMYTNGNNFRSVISVNGSAFWCAGANGGASSTSLRGIVYYAGGTPAKLLDINARCINIGNNQLFYSTQSGTIGIYALGSGLPTGGSPAASLVIGLAGGTPAPEAFQFNPGTNVCYIADSRATKGGVFKYTLVSGSWVSNYLFSVSGGTFGLAVDWSGANPVIYATTADGKNLVKIVDTGVAATPTTLATVDGTTKAFRGVAFAPKGSTAVAVSSSSNPSGFHDSISFSASLPAAATGNVTFKTNGVVLSVNAVSGGTATSAATSLFPRGTTTVTAEYAGDVNFFGSTNTLSGGQLVTNHPPTATIAAYSRSAGLNLKIALADLAGHWSDVDGDTVVLNGLGSSTNGAVLADDSNFIYYTDSSNVDDQFTYSVSDGHGGTANGSVQIMIASSTNTIPNLTSTTINNDNSITLVGAGIPNRTNIVQRAGSLAPPVNWIAIGTNIISANGKWQFTDPTPPSTNGFYRAVTQP